LCRAAGKRENGRTLIVLKSLLLITAALLAGNALAPALVGVPPRRGWRYAMLGLTVVVLGLSAWEVAANLTRLIGYFDWQMFWTYLQNTRHGHSVLLRAGAAVFLGAGLVHLPGEELPLPKAILALTLLFSFSYASHAAAMGGVGPMIVDWLHYVAVSAWLGALVAVAAGPIWTPATHALRVEAVTRLSAIGFAAVIAMAFTGVVGTLVHVSDPPSFVASPYARSWLLKVIIVATVVACAAWNRLTLVPHTRKHGNSNKLRVGILVEIALLAAVFVATGWLSTSPLPHTADASVNAFENLQGFIEYLKER